MNVNSTGMVTSKGVLLAASNLAFPAAVIGAILLSMLALPELGLEQCRIAIMLISMAFGVTAVRISGRIAGREGFLRGSAFFMLVGLLAAAIMAVAADKLGTVPVYSFSGLAGGLLAIVFVFMHIGLSSKCRGNEGCA